MIGTIRKHSGWLWALIIAATIVSFVFWGANYSKVGGGGGGGSVDLGSVYGTKVTPEQLYNAKKAFVLSYWFHSGKWPDDSSMTADEVKQQAYVNLMIAQKAEKLGIHISEDSLAAAANERLQAMGRNGQVVELSALVDQVLKPKGFGTADFENFVRDDTVVQELIQALGLPGRLITPQEASAAYERENEEMAVQVAFFSRSNYLSYVKATPEAVAQFYTNMQANYRLPDRVQIDYVAFDASNYLAQSKAEWAKTNTFSDTVEGYLHKLGENYKGATNADQARGFITQELVMQRAAGDARKDAIDLANKVFAVTPVKPENLATVAKQQGLKVHLTAPFDKTTGPTELLAAENFTAAAFNLTDDSPLAGPVSDGTASYVIALAKTLPSEIPSLARIRAQVTSDFERLSAIRMAQQAGVGFDQVLTNQMASGHTFASVCVANGHPAVVLPPFTITTQDLPELGGHATLAQIKQIAFTTPVGKASPFEPVQQDGGFILFLQSKLPPDKAKMTAALPQFTASLERNRQNEAFNQWVQTEANTALVMPKDPNEAATK